MNRYGTMVGILVLLGAGSSMAQVELNREDAMNFPSKHAWNLFLLVNHPAKDPKLGRGIPDEGKAIGTPGTTVVWETWRLSETEVFLEGGVKPPAWDDLSLPGGPVSGKVPDPPKSLVLELAEGPRELNLNLTHKALRPFFDPSDGIYKGFGGFGESRMNRATYKFVVDNDLFSIEGQQQYTRDFIAGNKPLLSFPVDSMEVKAAWVELTPEDIAAGKDKEHYIAEYEGKVYGLSSLHIITKDIPNWFWCTFHHEDVPDTGAETPDTYGMPKVLEGTVWEHYELGGTQTDFVDSIGQPTLLSDPYIEKGFEKSSCISCHARASMGPNGAGLSSSVVLGTPNPSDFVVDGKPVLMQTDFLFSLPFRAKSRKPEIVEHTIVIKDFEFDPASLTIKSGDAIIWQNDGNLVHSAEREGEHAFDTGLIPPGSKSDPIVMDASGETLTYICGPHPYMEANIIVED